ncbi:hypothetical protein [Candidatus Liberibacter brunswickensis]|uniref:hypothetical protein n=1 Tax=Candidatus Liberibacter brunswickensis TaxID=1968796 RepID=UPI002FE39D9B
MSEENKSNLQDYRIKQLEENHKELKNDVKEVNTKIDSLSLKMTEGFSKLGLEIADTRIEIANTRIEMIKEISSNNKWIVGIGISIFIAIAGMYAKLFTMN